MLDDLFSYRLEEERYLTVTNAANHERDLAWFRRHAGGFDAQVIDRAADYAMIAVQGPLAREIVQAIASAPLPERMTIGQRIVDGAQMLVAGTGYTGEDGVELLADPADAPAVWEALLRRGAKPAGLAARDTLRTEACYHLYGNDLGTERGPIEAGLGWCCRAAGGYIGAEAVAAVRAAGPSELLAPFVITDRGAARPGDAVVGGGIVTSGTFSPTPSERDRDGLPAGRDRGGGNRDRDRRARQAPPCARREAPALEGVSVKPIRLVRVDGRSDLSARAAVSPGARLGSHRWRRATFGITWHAQDALGEVVFFDPPAVGATVTQHEPYSEVESVKAVSDVIAPLSGEIIEVNEALGERPEAINEDPYGDGWIVKVQPVGSRADAGPALARRLRRAARLRR